MFRSLAPSFNPGLPGVTKTVKDLAREGMWQKALLVFSSIGTIGLSADVTLVNAAIGACMDGKSSTKARQIFDDLVAAGQEPDCVTYKVLIAAYLVCSEWRECVHVRSCLLHAVCSKHSEPELLATWACLARKVQIELRMCVSAVPNQAPSSYVLHQQQQWCL